MMKTSLICTIYNEESSILSFINSINNQIEKPDELVIVDGGSTDNSVNLLRSHLDESLNLNLIIDPTCTRRFCIGPIAKGRNIAVQNAKYEFILVTDAGCILAPDWVLEMKKSFSENTDIVSGNYHAALGNEFQNYIADMFCPDISPVHPKSFLPSSRSLAFRRKIWLQVGGYPTNSYTGEDTKFDLEIFKITNAVVFNKNAIVYWNLPRDWREMVAKVFNYGVGDGQQLNFIHKYVARAVAILFPPILISAVIFRKRKAIAFLVYAAQVTGYIKGLYLRAKHNKALTTESNFE